ncbi:aminotransferase class IV [Natronogracilivirga saccharolytica]|uniref:branched-chain-amino-acid transaminase n=1 Tax=Natronogracilivirga saccharolytica TaxID=2812953 RepID=A0A8J7UTC4_9BACT|nr:aminotransferase class IV [Natronogracilivirga saccharolytica]MBP3191195.1 aminotransferase class IV [Natronogracilivirga saccharolytica]
MSWNTASEKLPVVLFNDAFLPAEQASLSPEIRLARYGEGCFDTMRYYAGGFFRPEDHLTRLRKGLEHLGLEPSGYLADTDSFLGMLTGFLKANDALGQHVRIRVQVWADDITAGYRPGNRTAKIHVSGSRIITTTTGEKPAGVNLITSTVPRIPHAALPADVKWSNGINYILAARQAQSHNADDALMMTTTGWVSETTIANIFWIKDDFVFTPSVSCDLFPGIARNTIIEVLDEMDINTNQGAYSADFLKTADAVWICNSVRGIGLAGRIDNKEFPLQYSFFDRIQNRFASHINDNLQYVG